MSIGVRRLQQDLAHKCQHGSQDICKMQLYLHEMDKKKVKAETKTDSNNGKVRDREQGLSFHACSQELPRQQHQQHQHTRLAGLAVSQTKPEVWREQTLVASVVLQQQNCLPTSGDGFQRLVTQPFARFFPWEPDFSSIPLSFHS